MLTRPHETSGHITKKERAHGSQGHHLGGRSGHTALSADARNLEAIAADLRQAADLLFADHADAGRHPRAADYHDTGRDRAIPPSARRRKAMGDLPVLRDSGSSGRNCGGFLIGKEFLAGNPSALILGDNIFYGDNLRALLRDSARQTRGGTVFACWVDDPERYGVIEFDASYRPLRIVEKPKTPKSNYAVTGLYFYDERVVDVVREMKPSARGELDITDLNQWYLERGELHVERFGRGYAWLDAGTHESLLEASQFIHIVEKRQGLKIACPEEIAFFQGFIDAEQLLRLAEPMKATGYGQYLIRQAGLLS